MELPFQFDNINHQNKGLMEIKTVTRNIRFDSRKPTSSYKYQYGDKDTFDVLKIICLYGLEHKQIYEVESQYLKSTSKSIHFDAEQDGDLFSIEWRPKDVEPYIKRVK